MRFSTAKTSALGCIFLTGLFNPAPIHAQEHTARTSASASGAAHATVVRSLRAVSLAELSFGAVVVGREQGGAVIVSPSQPDAGYSGSVRHSPSCAANCNPHPAMFEVSGEAERSYRIELPHTVYAAGSRSGLKLAISALSVRSHNDPTVGNDGRLNIEGHDRFEIGGSLVIPQGTQDDVFRADLPVTVSYD